MRLFAPSAVLLSGFSHECARDGWFGVGRQRSKRSRDLRGNLVHTPRSQPPAAERRKRAFRSAVCRKGGRRLYLPGIGYTRTPSNCCLSVGISVHRSQTKSLEEGLLGSTRIRTL